MGLRWKRLRVEAEVLELMRAEMRRAVAWVAEQEAMNEDGAARGGGDATDDVTDEVGMVGGEWEEGAQWEGESGG